MVRYTLHGMRAATPWLPRLQSARGLLPRLQQREMRVTRPCLRRVARVRNAYGVLGRARNLLLL